ncbi:hypothetical protein [Spirosoma pomorum]
MKRTKNLLGQCFDVASKANQLKFKAALIEAGEEQNVDFARKFRETWQYVEALGMIPTAITDAARNYLNYNPQLPTTSAGMLSALRMKAA